MLIFLPPPRLIPDLLSLWFGGLPVGEIKRWKNSKSELWSI